MEQIFYVDYASQPTTAKKATTRKTAAGSSKQTQLSFTPAARSSTRAAATRARGNLVRICGDVGCPTNIYID